MEDLNEEMLDLIESEIQQIIESTGKFDESFPANQYLVRLKEAWLNGDYDEISIIANECYTETAKQISSNTSKAIEKNILARQQWIASFANKLTTDNPIIKYSKTDIRNAEAEDLAKIFGKCSIDQLSQLVAELIIEMEIKDARYSMLSAETEHLKSLFEMSLNKRIQKGQRTSASIKERFADNDAALEEIYAIALKNAQEIGQKIPTYLRFKRLIEALKSKPIYIRKPRLTPEEKQLPAEDLAYVVEEKTREDWSESTLRDFYKAKTGIDATTKK